MALQFAAYGKEIVLMESFKCQKLITQLVLGHLFRFVILLMFMPFSVLSSVSFNSLCFSWFQTHFEGTVRAEWVYNTNSFGGLWFECEDTCDFTCVRVTSWAVPLHHEAQDMSHSIGAQHGGLALCHHNASTTLTPCCKQFKVQRGDEHSHIAPCNVIAIFTTNFISKGIYVAVTEDMLMRIDENMVIIHCLSFICHVNCQFCKSISFVKENAIVRSKGVFVLLKTGVPLHQ